MYLPEPTPLGFSSLMNDVERGLIKIPQFQRDFVWSKEKSAHLLDSILKGYPIGTFIIWKTKDHLRSVRNLGDVELPPTPDGDYVNYILDGQQRLTTLFACMNGLVIRRDDRTEDFSEFYLDLEASEDGQIVFMDESGMEDHLIKLHKLLHGELSYLASFPEHHQKKLQQYQEIINSYHFSAIILREASIDVATEVFTRLNVGGKPLSVFEVMVAKTYDYDRDFDLAEKYDSLIEDLREVDYESVPEMTVLQTISIILSRDCRKKHMLQLKREDIIDTWPLAEDSIKRAVDYFRDTYRIEVSKLLPYPSLIVPFAYFFSKHPDKPSGEVREYLQDFFWRVSLSGRYSQSVEARLAQDVARIDIILKNKLPKYDWSVDTSADFVNENGYFSVGRSYIKALLCILAYHEPKSFEDNAKVRINNAWLKQANSRNYHHFFPKDYLKKKGEDADFINHIANITIVDDFLNKRKIRAKAPGMYIKEFRRKNPEINKCMKSHLIDLEKFGVLENDYDSFFEKRCRMFSKELEKRIIPQKIDKLEPAAHASMTYIDEDFDA